MHYFSDLEDRPPVPGVYGKEDSEYLPIYGSVALDENEIRRRKETLKTAPPKPPDGEHHYYYWNGLWWIAHHK